MSFIDPFINHKFNIWDGSKLADGFEFRCDVVIIGSGAGGAMAASVMAAKGKSVALIEEGPLKNTSQFKMNEAQAYPELYQESAARLTKDKGIKILQGRNVGGGTTVNWTTSFRTPDRTLSWWEKAWDVKDCSSQQMKPYFEQVEKMMGIKTWDIPANENNEILGRGLKKLGLSQGVIKRNVIDCQNLGYCGMGCPVGAKQSTLVTLIPELLKKGHHLGHHLRCEKLLTKNNKIEGVLLRGMDSRGNTPTKNSFKIFANKVILAAGAIGTPAILKRSSIPDPQNLVGKRTTVHPVCLSGAMMKDEVESWQGAPQVVYSDHFLETRPLSEKMGFKLEVPPIHPVILSSVVDKHGPEHRYIMENFPKFQAIIALMRDGFHDESIGGEVFLKDDGTPGLDYQITPYTWKGIKDAWLASAEIQFAAGAKLVWPIHRNAPFYKSWSEAKNGILSLPLEVLKAKLVSAHVMGGCLMSNDPKRGVVNSNGEHHHIDNLYVMDGSVFPTSVAANPMESILAFSLKNSQDIKFST